MNIFKVVLTSFQIFFLFNYPTYSQNLDMLTNIYSGKQASMAGAGISLAQGITSVDINPAGLANLKQRAISFSQYASYYRYSLNNIRKEENLTRIFEWSKFDYRPQSLLLALPVSNNLSTAFGYLNRINPYLYNERRAVTWSPLFNQETSGSIQSIILSAAYRVTDNFYIGATSYIYFGRIISSVHGENHDNDTDKWAKLKSSFSGASLKAGLKYKYKMFQFGAVLETPGTLNVTTKMSISENELYSYLFPNYKRTKFYLPLNIGVGINYSDGEVWNIALDYELRDYDKSNVRLNLYEYGGQPNWKNSHIYRFGIEYLDPGKEWIPVRVGYAFIPQLYASNISLGSGHNITSYIDKDQNIMHQFTMGTSFIIKGSEINIAYKYAFVKWHRDLYTYITVDEDYNEDIYSLSMDIVFPF